MHGLYVHIVHTGTINKTLFISDVYPTTDDQTFTSDSTGGGQSHANMAPFLSVNFIIKT